MDGSTFKLLKASGYGDLKSEADLLESGIPVDSKSDVGGTTLMAAARSYRVEVLRHLI